MQLEHCTVGKKLRVIRLTEGFSNKGWGFNPGDVVEVSGEAVNDSIPIDHVLVAHGETRMLGIFALADLMEDPVVGDRVRAHDFNNVGEPRMDGKRRPSYYEGVIRAIVNGDCLRYDIAVDKQVISGREVALGNGEAILTPVNGTMGSLSGVIFRVEKI